MKISLQWLQRYLDFDKPVPEVVEAITRLGLEVEGVESLQVPKTDLLVVGQVLSREPHPNADKLSVCRVEVGQAAPLQIVCGAQNYKVGDRVPVALVGCQLPEGEGTFTIKAAKLRGVESCGMMCAPDEIGLGGSHEGLLILDPQSPVGRSIYQILPSSAVFEVKATPNRADALSHYGIARDLAALWGLTLRDLGAPALPLAPCNDLKEVSIENLSDCSHYRGYVVRGVKVGPSPVWLRELLQSVGLRSISNVVDVTNYICLGLGQPLHAFDLAKLSGAQLAVRRARLGEKLITLEGTERALMESVLVIADAQKPLALAGVMGGQDSGVGESTSDILLEAAVFSPTFVRRASRYYALSSESSYRFERGLDPAMTQPAAELAVQMILQLAGGQLAGVVAAGGPAFTPRVFTVSHAYLTSRLGFSLSADKVERALTAFGLQLARQGEGWEVRVPSFRADIEGPIDLLEELLRFYGVDQIPSVRLVLPALHASDDPLYTLTHQLGSRLVSQGFYQCMHYTLRSGQELELLAGSAQAAELHLVQNPLSGEMNALRSSLVPGLLEGLRLNRSRGNRLLPLFEEGHIFRVRGLQLHELSAVAFVIPVPSAESFWDKQKPLPGFFEAKAILESLWAAAGAGEPFWQPEEALALWQPGHSACATAAGLCAHAGVVALSFLRQLGYSGLVVAGELVFDDSFTVGPGSLRRAKPFSAFPSTRRDVAVVVPLATPAGQVSHQLRQLAQAACGGLCALDALELFDLYTGSGVPQGAKSLAFSLHFRADDRTLTESEITPIFNAILLGLKSAGLATRQ